MQITNDEPSGWTGFTTLSQLVAQASQTAFGRDARLTLEFASLTAFSRGSSKRGFGTFPLMLPLPQMLIQNLLKHWEDIAPPELVGVIQREQVEQYLEEDGIIIIDYSLSAHVIHFTTHQQRGFLGTCTYQLRGQDHPISADAPLTIRQQIYLLSQLAFYTGIGYKTAMGLGQARLKK